MKRQEPLIQIAMLIRRRLSSRRRESHDHFELAAAHVREEQQSLNRVWTRLVKARDRGWYAAARQVQGEFFRQAQELQSRLAELLEQENVLAQVSPDPPTLGLIAEELAQLQREFDVELDPAKQVIAAQTESIELEGVDLGPFMIELHIDRLDRRFDSGCFDLVAIEPNPASSDDSVTHPHVRDKALCTGDATVPLSQALRQGRIADAFCIINSVLKTYNPGSPFVHLDNWDGTSCPECGGSVGHDDLYRCTSCDNDFCESCISSCEICDDSTCTDCLERDPVTRRYCCPGCRSICSRCGRVVEQDDFDEEAALCPQCCPPDEGDQPSTEDNHEPETESLPAEPAQGAAAQAELAAR